MAMVVVVGRGCGVLSVQGDGGLEGSDGCMWEKEKRVWVWLNGWDGKLEGWIVEQEVWCVWCDGVWSGVCAGFKVQRGWQQSRGRGRSRRQDQELEQDQEHGRYRYRYSTYFHYTNSVYTQPSRYRSTWLGCSSSGTRKVVSSRVRSSSVACPAVRAGGQAGG